MIYGQIIVSFLSFYLNAYYTQKLLDYSIIEQIRDFIPSLALAGVMGVGVYALHYASITDELVLLIVQIITGVVLYSSMCYLFRISSYMEIIKLIKSRGDRIV